MAGVDQDLGGYSFPSLTQAVRAGLVNTTFIDRAVANVLRAKFAAGLFDEPLTSLSLLDQLDSKAHRDLARRVATEGAVLLLNNKDINNGRPVLPLKLDGIKTIAIIGPNADDAMAMGGGYFPKPAPNQFVTTLTAFRQRVPAGTTVLSVDPFRPFVTQLL